MLRFIVLAASFASAVTASPVVPSSETFSVFNSTLQARWVQPTGQGIFQDGVTLLMGANGSNTTSPTTQEGVMLQFNQTVGLAANDTTSSIPFVALVSCDEPEAMFGAVMMSNASTTINSTSMTNSTSMSNATSNTNVTSSSTLLPDVFALAADLNAVALIFYSELQETCTLNISYFMNNTNSSLPVYALPRRQSTTLLLEQFNNVDEINRIFNATRLEAAAANLTSVQSGGSTGALPGTGFLLSQILPNSTDDASPVVATIGRASSSTSSTSSATSQPQSTALATGTGASTTPAPSSPPVSGAMSLSPDKAWIVPVLSGAALVAGVAVLI